MRFWVIISASVLEIPSQLSLDTGVTSAGFACISNTCATFFFFFFFVIEKLEKLWSHD